MLAAFDRSDDYLGIPYDDVDRGRDGLPCYSLGRLILREQLGVEIPEQASAHSKLRNARAFAEGKIAWPWRDVSNGPRRPFDFVIYAIGAIDDHMGVIVDPDWMIHVQRGDISRLDKIDDPRFGRISGVYRHEALA